jgi:hypothetical protein
VAEEAVAAQVAKLTICQGDTQQLAIYVSIVENISLVLRLEDWPSIFNIEYGLIVLFFVLVSEGVITTRMPSLYAVCEVLL